METALALMLPGLLGGLILAAALARLNRSGVPVYAVYTPARREPLLLPEVLTRATVLDALALAKPRAAQASTMISNLKKETP